MGLTIDRVLIANSETERAIRGALEAVGVPPGEEWTATMTALSRSSAWELTLQGPTRTKSAYFDWEILQQRRPGPLPQALPGQGRADRRLRQARVRKLVWERIQFRENPIRAHDERPRARPSRSPCGACSVTRTWGPLHVRFGVWREGLDGMKFVCKVESRLPAPTASSPGAGGRRWSARPQDLAAELGGPAGAAEAGKRRVPGPAPRARARLRRAGPAAAPTPAAPRPRGTPGRAARTPFAPLRPRRARPRRGVDPRPWCRVAPMPKRRPPRPRQDPAPPLRGHAARPRPHPAAGGRDVPDLLDVHQRLRLRQRRHGHARPAAGARAPSRASRCFVKSDGGQRHGGPAHGPPAAPLHAPAHGGRAPELRLRRHHAGPGRRHDRDGPAVVPDRGGHVARARPLARRPHQQPGGGQQRRGGARDPPLEGDAGRGPRPVNPYQELYKYLHPLVIGALDRASSLSLMLCREILGYHMQDRPKAERISRQLNSSYPAHQYPITSREARRLGLHVMDLDPELDDAAAGAEPPLLGDGPAGHHRLRRGEPPRQRDHEHPGGAGPAGLLPGGEGLALPQGRAALGAHERRLGLVPRAARRTAAW